METIKAYERELKRGANPRDSKIQLAKALVTQYHSKEAAETEAKYFAATFSKKEVPDDLPTISPTSHSLISVLVDVKLARSASDARRVIGQRGVKVNGEVVTDLTYEVPAGAVLQKGKLGFVKVL